MPPGEAETPGVVELVSSDAIITAPATAAEGGGKKGMLGQLGLSSSTSSANGTTATKLAAKKTKGEAAFVGAAAAKTMSMVCTTTRVMRRVLLLTLCAPHYCVVSVEVVSMW